MDTIYAFVDVVFRSRFTGALVWLADPSRTRRDGKGSIISINPVFRMNFNIVGFSIASLVPRLLFAERARRMRSGNETMLSLLANQNGGTITCVH